MSTPSTADTENRRGPAVLSRGLRVLRAFTDLKPEWGVRELGRELRMDPATVHRILKTLKTEGFLQYEPSRRIYTIGTEFYRISAIVQQTSPVIQSALQIMAELVTECEETVSLGMYDAQALACTIIRQVQTTKSIRHVSREGFGWPLHAGAGAHAILAFLDREVVETVLSRPLAQFTKYTPRDPATIRKSLLKVRRLGYSLSNEECTIGGVGIGAPVWNANGVFGALVVVMPKSRYRAGVEKWIGPRVAAAASRLSSALGGRRTREGTEGPF